MKNYTRMKKVSIIILAIFCFTACKKDKTTDPVCNRVSEINGQKIVYDADERMIEFTDKVTGKITVGYKNDNKTIDLTFAGGSERIQLDNNGYYIKAELYNAAGIMTQSITVGRNANGYMTDEVAEIYKPDGSFDQRAVYNYVNTFDANGNLVTMTASRSGYPTDTVEYIYDNSKQGVKLISGEGSLLYEINPLSKNLLIREKLNGKDRYLYTYTTDSKARVIYNKCAALTASGTGYEATIQYDCN